MRGTDVVDVQEAGIELSSAPWSRNPSTSRITVASAVCLSFLVFAGWLSDRIGRIKVYAGTAILMIFLVIGFFALLQSGNEPLIILAFALSLVPWPSQYGAQPALILESFDTRTATPGPASATSSPRPCGVACHR